MITLKEYFPAMDLVIDDRPNLSLIKENNRVTCTLVQ